MRANRVWAAQASALAMGLALAGCGGASGGGSVVSTPTPTPSSYTKIADMTGDRTFQTAGIQYTSSPAGLTNATTLSFGSGVTVAYTASTDSYKLTAPDGTTSTFNPADALAPSPAAPTTQRWSKLTGGTREDLSLTVPSSNGVALSYTIVGSWGRLNVATNQAQVRLAVGGAPTLANDMPRTGTATYAAGAGGSAVQGGALYQLSGNSSATFSANFAGNSVTTALTLAGVPVGSGAAPTSFGTFNGTGTISSTGPGFTGTFSGTAATGGFSGSFFGPKALEMGYNWYLSGSTLSASGTVIGVKQ